MKITKCGFCNSKARIYWNLADRNINALSKIPKFRYKMANNLIKKYTQTRGVVFVIVRCGFCNSIKCGFCNSMKVCVV